MEVPRRQPPDCLGSQAELLSPPGTGGLKKDPATSPSIHLSPRPPEALLMLGYHTQFTGKWCQGSVLGNQEPVIRLDGYRDTERFLRGTGTSEHFSLRTYKNSSPHFVQLNPFADIPGDLHLPTIQIENLSQQMY